MLSAIETKVIAMFGLGGGSFILGIIPLCFSPSLFVRRPLSMSSALCFGGGVLLATAIVHMLPEVQRKLPDIAEPVFCAGFFLLYFIDEIVHFFWTAPVDREQMNIRQTNSCGHRHHNRRETNYGSTEVTEEHCDANSSTSLLCHTSFTEPCQNSSAGRVGLFVALSLHATLEGLAIGLQESPSKVLLLVGAVACHKLVVALCLGIELSAARVGIWKHVSQIAVFSLGCVTGVGIGMGITQMQNSRTTIAVPILQAVAGGTLLYVTVCEVLPRERAKWHHQSSQRAAGIIQFFSVAAGFSIIMAISVIFGQEQINNGNELASWSTKAT